tara:strand:+ start:601 stop:1377 length:777 start_codon:yes stop_codon:yes gene_type:complete
VLLRYLSKKSCDDLVEDIVKNFDVYKSRDFISNSNLSGSNYHKEIDISELKNLKNDVDKDIENSDLVYRVLKDLTPMEAQFEEIWTYLTHFHCIDYVTKRWASDFVVNSSDDIEVLENREKVTIEKKIRDHFDSRFFVTKTRSLFARNGLSRLWWTSHICSEMEKNDSGINKDDALAIAFSCQDLHSGIFERPSISSDINLLSSMFRYLNSKKNLQKDDPKNRKQRRDWLKKINFKFSGIVNIFEKNELDEIIEGLDS